MRCLCSKDTDDAAKRFCLVSSNCDLYVSFIELYCSIRINYVLHLSHFKINQIRVNFSSNLE